MEQYIKYIEDNDHKDYLIVKSSSYKIKIALIEYLKKKRHKFLIYCNYIVILFDDDKKLRPEIYDMITNFVLENNKDKLLIDDFINNLSEINGYISLNTDKIEYLNIHLILEKLSPFSFFNIIYNESYLKFLKTPLLPGFYPTSLKEFISIASETLKMDYSAIYQDIIRRVNLPGINGATNLLINYSKTPILEPINGTVIPNNLFGKIFK